MTTKRENVTAYRTRLRDEALAFCGQALERLNELADELESVRDGLEERFSATERYERISQGADAAREAADALEVIRDGDLESLEF